MNADKFFLDMSLSDLAEYDWGLNGSLLGCGLVRDDQQNRLPRRNKRLARSRLALLLLATTEGP